MPDWEACGLRPTKPLHPLFVSNFDYYQAAIDWVRDRLRGHGYDAVRATLDPPVELWRFYDPTGTLIVNVPHDLIDTVRERLRIKALEQEDAA